MTERGDSRVLTWALRPWMPWIVAAAVVFAAIAVAAVLYRQENYKHQTHFALAANEQMNALEMGVHMHFRPVQHVATTLSLRQGKVDAHDFHLLAQSIPLAHSPALLELQWWTRAPSDSTNNEVFAVRYRYRPSTRIPGEKDADLRTIPPGTLTQAQEQRGLFIGPWYKTRGQVRFRVLRPVFAKETNGARMLGFISGVYRVDRLLTAVLCPATEKAIEVFVSDSRGEAGAFRCLHGTSVSARADAVSVPSDRRITHAVPVDGTPWLVTAIAKPGAFTASRWIPIFIALGGLLLGAILGMFHRTLLSRETQVRRLVMQRTEALRQRTEELESVYRSAPVGLAVLDRELHYLRINDRLAELNGIPAEAHIGKTPRETVPAIADAIEALGRRVITTGETVRDFEFRGASTERPGAERFYTTHWLPLKDEAGRVWGINVVLEETTERRRLEARTRHLAEHDPLTDLPNRRLLLALLDATLRTAQRSRHKVALLFLDLDRFKSINDSLGHQTGDALLKAVAKRLARRLRRADTIARLGGDEFTVLVSDFTRGDQVGEVAEDIVRAFRDPFRLADQSLYVTTSIGISLYPDDGDTAEGLLRQADLAMYEAKDQGRNTFRFYNPTIDLRARERVRIENALRHALGNDGLYVAYQPQIDLRTGRVLSVEALLRWHHPQLGLLEPARFVPLAEETDLIVSLDDWVLHTACAQVRQWQDQGLDPICVCVNLSAKRFEHPGLVETVQRCLAESELATECLELELTERTAMRHFDQSVERMRELGAMGVRFAIDDFGTGYSSLNYLKRLPIGKLKIDQSFVRDIPADSDDRSIIEAVTALGHSLSKRVTAEGVETEAQRAFLEATGCDEAQGYLFAKPLSAEQFSDWFRR